MNEQDLLGYLRDAAQGASNSAASTVSGPVDLLAWLLKKGGVPVGNAPVMGSEWMAQKGLTAKPANALAGMAGETIGNISPIVAAAKAPQIANALLRAEQSIAPTVANMAENYMVKQGMIQPATVWHGSPHKFDKFDSSKIGTGEGAQAYGHGLYLAENPTTAEQYRQALSTWKTTLNGVPLTPDHPQFSAAMSIGANGYEGALKQAKDAKRLGFITPEFADQEIARIVALKDAKITSVRDGHVYKVDLPDNAIARMLDWDKPLSQQAPWVRSALAETVQKSVKPYPAVDGSTRYMATLGNEQKAFRTENEALDFLSSNLNGGAAYLLSGEGVQASNLLARQGIPGIRYLDGGSRGAGAGTSNYVVFPGEENMLRILERNGVPIGK